MGEIQPCDDGRPVAARAVNSPPPAGERISLVSPADDTHEDPAGGCFRPPPGSVEQPPVDPLLTKAL